MAIHRLNDRKMRTSKSGLLCDGAGLWLRTQLGKNGELKRSWLFRYGKHWHGLGSLDDVGLAEAREARTACRKLLREGVDPIAAKRQTRSAAAVANAKAITFEECARQYVIAKASEWRSARNGWIETLDRYAFPIIGPLQVKDVDTGLVLKVIEPDWATKTQTMSRLRGRIEKILAWAAVRGYRSKENPARWTGHLAEALPRKPKPENFAAVPYAEVGAFMAQLREAPGVAARALEFLILTATRSGEVLGAKWDEVDLAKAMWTIPADRTKAHREHRVPLSPRAVEILREMEGIRHSDHVFPGRGGGRPNGLTLRYVMRDMGRTETVHGFRSAFGTWSEEQTGFPAAVVEAALGHIKGDKVEAAYKRGDILMKRRKLMEAARASSRTSLTTARSCGAS